MSRSISGPRDFREFRERRQRQRPALLGENMKNARFFFAERARRPASAFHATIFCTRACRCTATSRDSSWRRRSRRSAAASPPGNLRRRSARTGLSSISQERKQSKIGDFFLAAISRRIEFGAPRAPRIGQQEFALVPQIDLGRQHRAKYFSRRRHVVAADPSSKLQQFRRQRRESDRALRQFP